MRVRRSYSFRDAYHVLLRRSTWASRRTAKREATRTPSTPSNRLMFETRVVEGLPPATGAGAEETTADTNAEEPTFEALYRTHAKRIYSLAWRFTGNAADAEELLQDIFLQAYRKLDSFRQEAALSTWLHRLAVNRCLDHLRSRAARQDARTGSLADETRPQPRAGPPARSPAWTSSGRSRSSRTAIGPRSCCTTSRATSTRRSPRCSASRPAPPSRRCTRLACGSVPF